MLINQLRYKLVLQVSMNNKVTFLNITLENRGYYDIESGDARPTHCWDCS